MALPKNIEKASESFNEYSDCSVKAVAIVCGVSYGKAHKAMADQGRVNRKCAYEYQIHGAIRSFGKTLKITDRFTAKTLTSLDKQLPSRGIFLVGVRGHIVACRAGEVKDWTEGRRHRILSVYAIK